MNTSQIEGSEIRRLRRSAGLTQQQLADLAGASRSMVRMLEQGYEPRRGSSVRKRIAGALETIRES